MRASDINSLARRTRHGLPDASLPCAVHALRMLGFLCLDTLMRSYRGACQARDVVSSEGQKLFDISSSATIGLVLPHHKNPAETTPRFQEPDRGGGGKKLPQWALRRDAFAFFAPLHLIVALRNKIFCTKGRNWFGAQRVGVGA